MSMSVKMTPLSIEAIFQFLDKNHRSHLKSKIPDLRPLHPPEYYEYVRVLNDEKFLKFKISSFFTISIRKDDDKRTRIIRNFRIFGEFAQFYRKEDTIEAEIEKVKEKLIKNVINQGNVMIGTLNYEGDTKYLEYFHQTNIEILQVNINTSYIPPSLTGHAYHPGCLLKFSGKIRELLVFTWSCSKEMMDDLQKMNVNSLTLSFGTISNIENSKLSQKKLKISHKHGTVGIFLQFMKKFVIGSHSIGSYYRIEKFEGELIETSELFEKVLEFLEISRSSVKFEENTMTIEISENQELLIQKCSMNGFVGELSGIPRY